MSKKKKNRENNMNSFNGFMPMFPGMMPQVPSKSAMPMMPLMPFMQNANNPVWAGKGDRENYIKEDQFKAEMKKFWEKMAEMQKSNADNSKDQWNRFFKDMMEMQESFAASMQGKAMPGFPFAPFMDTSPKAIKKRMKKFRKMMNAQFEEQADFVADLFIKK